MDNFKQTMIEEAEFAKIKIEKLKKKDSVIFPLFTDLHTDDCNHEYTKKLIYMLKCVTEKIEYDAVIDLGDNFRMLGREIQIKNDELEKRFEDVFKAIYETVQHPIINVNGNHDGVGTDFFKPDFWNNIVKNKYGNTLAVYDDFGSYYYIDYEKADTRLVVLSLPSDSDVKSNMPAPAWEFGKQQLKWLKNTALNTEKYVIILCHVPLYYKYTGDKESTLAVWDGECEKQSYISELCGEIKDIDEAAEILNSFNKETKGRLVTAISGHTHKDSTWHPMEQKDEFKNPLSCCQFVTMASCSSYGIERIKGASMDILVWTPSEGELNLIRVGDGQDRNVSFLKK